MTLGFLDHCTMMKELNMMNFTTVKSCWKFFNYIFINVKKRMNLKKTFEETTILEKFLQSLRLQ